MSLNSNVLFGAVYIPPENSKYSSIEAFDELENELVTISSSDNSYVALIGDFNSKTGFLNDFIVPDESITSIFYLDCDNEILSYLYDFENLTLNNIPLQRISQCTCRPNRYGHNYLICVKNIIYT